MATGTIQMTANKSGTGYCKMPDGTLIQWGRITVTDVPITKAWGALYESSAIDSGTVFQIPFIARPTVSATAHVTPGAWIESLNTGVEKLGNLYLALPVTEAAASGYIDWIAIGRWK